MVRHIEYIGRPGNEIHTGREDVLPDVVISSKRRPVACQPNPTIFYSGNGCWDYDDCLTCPFPPEECRMNHNIRVTKQGVIDYRQGDLEHCRRYRLNHKEQYLKYQRDYQRNYQVKLRAKHDPVLLAKHREAEAARRSTPR